VGSLGQVSIRGKSKMAWSTKRAGRRNYSLQMLSFIFGNSGVAKPADLWVIAQEFE
jgi:hypothetical protein